MFAVPDSFSWPMANFAQTLRDLRSSRKLTQTRLAELLQVSPRVYSRWETGDVTPHFDTIVRIAEMLEVSLDELAGRTETLAPPKIHNHELHRLYLKVDQLSDEDQKALLVVLDSLVKRFNMSRVMAE